MKICQDPEVEQEEAAVAADLEEALAAVAVASAEDLAAVAADSVEDHIITTTITDPVFTADSGDLAVITADLEAVALADCWE